MKFYLFFVVVALVGCRPDSSGSEGGEAEAQAVQRSVINGEFTITARKPNDMKIAQSGNQDIPFRTAGGQNGLVSILTNPGHSFVSVEQALADGIFARLKGQVMRDVFLIPRVNAQVDPLIVKAQSESWRIEKIVSNANNFGEVKGVKIFCPNRIEFRKPDGSRHVSEFPFKSCESELRRLYPGAIFTR